MILFNVNEIGVNVCKSVQMIQSFSNFQLDECITLDLWGKRNSFLESFFSVTLYCKISLQMSFRAHMSNHDENLSFLSFTLMSFWTLDITFVTFLL